MKKMHYFNITYACDSNCKFCAANVGLISNRDYTISLEKFEEQLINENVQSGDYVMISGGEPTLSPYFWKILDICKKYDCYIELTTNGHYFADYNNARKLISYDYVNVQIPLFGTEIQHDYLTGYKGGFVKTIQALDNFASLLCDNHFSVSVKFLLCKATVEGNVWGYDYCKNRYSNKFYYYLNALLVSEKTKLNAEELLEPYSVSIEKMGNFIENEDVIVDTIPLCLLSENKLNYVLKKKHVDLKKIYSDAKLTDASMDNYLGSKCRACRMEKFCDKFLPSYIEYFGDGEIKPFY